jgi:hypothetical protein
VWKAEWGVALRPLEGFYKGVSAMIGYKMEGPSGQRIVAGSQAGVIKVREESLYGRVISATTHSLHAPPYIDRNHT